MAGLFTLIAPSLPPVMSSNSAGSVPRVTMEESTMPEWALHEAVQSKVSEYLCKGIGTGSYRAYGGTYLNLPIGRTSVKVRP